MSAARSPNLATARVRRSTWDSAAATRLASYDGAEALARLERRHPRLDHGLRPEQQVLPVGAEQPPEVVEVHPLILSAPAG
jgi:hypothetical protein